MKVKVTFIYEPEQPDPTDPTGMSEVEYSEIIETLMELGGTDFQFEKEG